MSEQQDEQAKAEAAAREAQRVKGVIAAAVLAADLPAEMQTLLMKTSMKEDEIEARIAHAKEVTDLCKTAGHPKLAQVFVAAAAPVETVRQQLVDLKAETSGAELDVTLPDRPAGNGKTLPTTAASIYESRRQQTEKHLSR